MEKREPSYTVGGDVSWCSRCGEHMGVPKVELPSDPAMPLLGIYPDQTLIEKDTCTPVFTAAVFTIVKHGSKLNIHWQMNG